MHASQHTDCLERHYFYVDSPARDIPRCAPAPEPAPLQRTLRIDLYYSDRRADAELAELTRKMQAAVRHWGIHFVASGAARPTELHSAISGSAEAIEAALDDAGISTAHSLDAEHARRARHATADVMFAELRAFVERADVNPQPDLNLILLEQLVEPQLSQTLFGSERSGMFALGLSPSMLARIPPSDPGSELQALTGLPPGFTPLVLLGAQDLAVLPGDTDNILAHELGHALGLIHDPDPKNAMHKAPKVGCRAYLNDHQLGQIAAIVTPD